MTCAVSSTVVSVRMIAVLVDDVVVNRTEWTNGVTYGSVHCGAAAHACGG